MPIDPSIPLSAIGRQPAVNPFEVAQSLQAMQINRQNSAVLNEQRQALADERKRKLADQDSLDAAVKPGLNIDQVVANLPGHMHAAVRKQFAEADEANTKAKNSRLKADADESDYFGSLAASVKSYASQGPESMLSAAQFAITHAKANGHDTAQIESVLKQNPNALPQVLDSLIAASPEQRKLATSDAAAANDRAQLPGIQADAAVKQQVAAGTKNGLTPEQQATNARAAATTAETARHNRNEEGFQRQTRSLEQAKFDATYGQGKDENGQPVASPLAKAIAEYRQPGFTGRSAATGVGASVMKQVLELNPSYDGSQFPSRQKMRIAFTSGPQSQTLNSLNTAIVHLDQFVDAAKELGNGNFRPGNAAYNALRAAFGDTAPTNFDGIKTIMSGELAAAFKKSGATDQEIEKVQKSVEGSNSVQQLIEYATKVAMPALGGKAATSQEQYHAVMGDKDPFDVYTPSARAVLDKYNARHGGSQSGQNAGGGPKVGERRTINGQLGEWDGKGWKAVQQ